MSTYVDGRRTEPKALSTDEVLERAKAWAEREDEDLASGLRHQVERAIERREAAAKEASGKPTGAPEWRAYARAATSLSNALWAMERHIMGLTRGIKDLRYDVASAHYGLEGERWTMDDLVERHRIAADETRPAA